MKYFFQLLIISVLLFSCNIRIAKKYEGTYECKIHTYQFDILSGSSSEWSEGIVNLERENTTLNWFERGKIINASDIKDGYYEEIGHYGSPVFQIHFLKDSIRITFSGSGHGGSSSTNYYGTKISD